MLFKNSTFSSEPADPITLAPAAFASCTTNDPTGPTEGRQTCQRAHAVGGGYITSITGSCAHEDNIARLDRGIFLPAGVCGLACLPLSVALIDGCRCNRLAWHAIHPDERAPREVVLVVEDLQALQGRLHDVFLECYNFQVNRRAGNTLLDTHGLRHRHGLPALRLKTPTEGRPRRHS